MKLFYIANIRMPTEKAHGLQIAKMCEAFAARGLEVELIVPEKDNTIKESAINYYNIKENFKITELYAFDFLRLERINNFLIYIQSLFFAIGVFIYVLFNPNKFSDDAVLYLRDEFSPWLLMLLKKKVFLEIHAFKNRFKGYRIFFSKLKGLILITEKAKEEFIAAGIEKEKCLVFPDAVDLARFDIDISKEDARQKLGLPQDKKIVLYAGSFYLHSWKGIDVILESAKEFSDNFLFVLVGGKEKEIADIRSQYQASNILLIPQKPNKDIPLYLKAADVLVLPNKKGDPASERYTSPLKLFEYMAARRPIVASRLPSIEEILNDKNSILVQANQPQKLADGIKKALDENSQKLIDQAFQDVRNYTWDKRVEKILEFVLS